MTAIREKKTVGSGDMVRLLDGCLDVPGCGYSCIQEYRPNMKHMLLVHKISGEKNGAEIQSEVNSSAEGKEATPDIYSDVKLNREGRKLALLLSCEDRNGQVILFVLLSIVEDHVGDGRQCRNALDGLMESVEEQFREGRTVMHYAAEDQSHKKENAGNTAKDIAELLIGKFDGGEGLVTAADKCGTTALHLAAFHGNVELCRYLIESCKMKADQPNQNGENLLHFSVRGKTSKVFEALCNLPGVNETIDSQDAQGKTALHKAAAKGGSIFTMVEVLFSQLKSHERRQYIHRSDQLGQTALHEATRRGHRHVVRILLDRYIDDAVPLDAAPLIMERDFEGKTALQYAVEFPDQSSVVMARSLLDRCKSEERKYLLLWASTSGIGAPEGPMPESAPVRKYLEEEKSKLEPTTNLLESAVKFEWYEMACELVNKGANPDMIAKSPSARVQNFLKQIKRMPARGRDQPTVDDGLGRQNFAEGLAAFFLNPSIKMPVTVGIYGKWGMGKSSLMIQTEINLLKTAAQLLFPNLLVTEQFPGYTSFNLSAEGKRKYMKIKNAAEYLKLEDLKADEDPLVYFLENYQEKYHKVYRALALMDHKEMFQEEKLNSSSNKYSLADIPSILTIRYNAWQYQNEREAWAGLAAEIPKEIEKSMTCAQRLRCRWRHAWKEHRSKMILELFLPCFLALFLSGLVALVLWRLFSRSKDKELVQLKYGSIPLTIVAAVWVVIKQVNSVLKPISDQIMGYLSIPNHSVNLGYQHQVISDIKFSKKEFGEKPSLKWKLVSFLWRFCGLFPDNVKGTSISKSPPACKDDIRIIVFVDDLDRCRDAVILKVLSAVNLVLAACEISVILGMDKEMVIRAIHSQYKNDKAESAADLAEKYLSKIVQLPLALPDVMPEELTNFVEQQLGPDFQASCVEDCDSDANKEDPNTDGRGCHCALDMEGCGSHCRLDMESSKKSCLGLVSKIFQSLKPVTRFTSRLFRCKLGTEDSTSERLKTPLKMMLLLPNYTPKERIAISWLSVKAARLERLPREWKRFLTYHRLAWNILYQSKQVRNCPGWQVQLLVWTFCCWQWKDQINEIIKNWENLMNLNGSNNDELNRDGPAEVEKDSDVEDEEKNDVALKQPLPSNNGKLNRDGSNKQQPLNGSNNGELNRDGPAEVEEDEENNDRDKENKDVALKQPLPSLRNIVQRYVEENKKLASEPKRKRKGKEIEIGNQQKRWDALISTLNKYDVSMECIQAFRKFRLHCRIQNLHFPLPKSKMKESDIFKRSPI